MSNTYAYVGGIRLVMLIFMDWRHFRLVSAGVFTLAQLVLALLLALA